MSLLQLFYIFAPFLLVVVTVLTVILSVYSHLKNKRRLIQTQPAVTTGRYKTARRVAILIASKDGEQTIADTVRYARRNRRHVYVVSDGSTDSTSKYAKIAGARVYSLRKNVGKPTALYKAYKHFNLSDRYDAVAILDDDVLIDKHFVACAKKLLSSDTAISVGQNITYWPPSRKWNVWLATRAYSYWSYQILLRTVQSEFNVMNCISGSNSLYRTEVLDEVLSISTPYIVDDTYWTLETHRLKLGTIVYSPQAKALIQDPTTYADWYKQNLRWMWGTFQGVIGHRIGTKNNRFHIAYLILLLEWALYILSLPFLIWVLLIGGIASLPLQLAGLCIGYGIWVIGAAISLKTPRLIIFIPAVILADIVFRGIMVHALIKAIKQPTVESCVWKSPKRMSANA